MARLLYDFAARQTAARRSAVQWTGAQRTGAQRTGAQQDLRDYAVRLMAAFPAKTGEADEARQVEPAPSTHPALVEPLSERELEVLALVAAGLSNGDIAEELVVSVNTVKTHVRSIYGKLGVHSRTQATAKAQALGILLSS
jgi:LuxR family maltose regulon positive regulatory protein